MRQIPLLIAALMSATVPMAAVQAAPPAASAAQTGELIKVKVNGLVCDFCAQSLKKTFGRMSAVAKVDVDLTAKLVSIRLKPGTSLSDATIRKEVTDAGYNMVSVSRS